MVDYNRLINKYYKKDGKNITGNIKIHKAEKMSNEYHRQRRQEAREKHRYLLLQELVKETPFNLTPSQINQIEYWITSFNNNFKNFHRKSSEETILLAFIMIQRKKVNPKLQVEKFTISRKYKLNNQVFELIQNRLIFELMRTTPLTYSQAKHYNHEILIKKGRRTSGASNVK